VHSLQYQTTVYFCGMSLRYQRALRADNAATQRQGPRTCPPVDGPLPYTVRVHQLSTCSPHTPCTPSATVPNERVRWLLRTDTTKHLDTLALPEGSARITTAPLWSTRHTSGPCDHSCCNLAQTTSVTGAAFTHAQQKCISSSCLPKA
jgi:hypothetical protein